jgi:transcription initiation factor IIE alpha subunit
MQGDMSFQCSKCGKTLEKNECYEHQGKVFCEDCYMDILSPPKACDPWAVHSAKTFLRGKDKLSTLTPLQLKMVNYIRQRGEATVEEMVENLNLTQEEFRREFATLRHMEVLRGTKKDGKIFCLLF